MTRESEAQLLDFCARQQGAFEEAAWLESRIVSREEMAATCLFLGGADWFGHKQQLVSVAETLLEASQIKFAELASQIGFDCSRFANLLKRRIGHA